MMYKIFTLIFLLIPAHTVFCASTSKSMNAAAEAITAECQYATAEEAAAHWWTMKSKADLKTYQAFIAHNDDPDKVFNVFVNTVSPVIKFASDASTKLNADITLENLRLRTAAHGQPFATYAPTITYETNPLKLRPTDLFGRLPPTFKKGPSDVAVFWFTYTTNPKSTAANSTNSSSQSSAAAASAATVTKK